MTVTSVSGATFLADTSILLRDKLLNNITDPIASLRIGNERFVMTEYPSRAVKYPIITIVDRGVSQPQGLGMGSEGTVINITMEIRIWARNVKERDQLFDDVYNYLKNNQLDSNTGLVASNLNDFKLVSAININEPGEEGIKSKVLELNFMFINE
jgi:hypothetical protein